MAEVIIRKHIAFDFLGDEYKEGFIVFKSITYDENQLLLDEAKEAEDNKAVLDYIKTVLTDRFIEGKFPNAKGELEDMTVVDIGKLDNDSILECFKRIMGGKLDPKV